MSCGRDRKPGPKLPEGELEHPVLSKKHGCPDCHFCQLCSDSRCNACRGGKKKGTCNKLSFSEQIRLYEELNSKDPILRKRYK